VRWSTSTPVVEPNTDTSGSWNHPVLGTFNAEVNGTVVTPEPGTLGLIGVAGLALAYRRRRVA
jgi:hypothetical protein